MSESTFHRLIKEMADEWDIPMKDYASNAVYYYTKSLLKNYDKFRDRLKKLEGETGVDYEELL